jgi:glyoxylase-like metal-dependent hydrolase (beta-lactamase superfamily II)
MLNQIQTLVIEIDMLSLGDADALLITSHTSAGIVRVLIDGGKGSDAATVKEFLQSKGATDLYAIVCTHGHDDHASGLIKLVQEDHHFYNCMDA